IDVIDVLSDLFILRGIPAHIRSDNGPEFVAKAVQDWIAVVGAKTAYIERGSPWENGYIESFNARLRDELLDGEIFYTLPQAQIGIESWRRHYNMIRPHDQQPGYQTLHGLGRLGAAAPTWRGYLIAAIELFGGLAILIGIKTRWVACALVAWVVIATAVGH